MAGNVNTAATRIARLAVKYSALLIGPRANKATGASARDMVRCTIKGAAGQTANLLEVVDSGDVVLGAIDKDGRVNVPNLKYALVTIAAADIVGTAAGQLGHAAGVVLVADPGAGKVVELIDALMSYTYSTAAYTGGGNVTVNINGGAALSGLVSAANSLGAAADKAVQFVPLSTAGIAITVNKGLNLVSSAAFTQPGTAAGTIKVFVAYRVYTL